MTGPDDSARRYVERMGSALTDAGLQRMPARVFAALTIDDDGRMTSSELVDVLAVSPASVSTAVQYLSRVGFIHRERERGTRRDVYVVDDDAWLQAMLREPQVYGPIVTALEEAMRDLDPTTSSYRRLHLMAEFLTFVGSEMRGMAARWLVRRQEIERELLD